MSQPSDDIEQWYDAVVIDADGERLGTVGQIYLDDATEEPTFITIRTGLFGTKETFVPVHGAEFSGDGELRVRYARATIKDAPVIDPEGHVDPSEQTALFRHYGIGGDTGTDTDTGTGTDDDPGPDAG